MCCLAAAEKMCARCAQRWRPTAHMHCLKWRLAACCAPIVTDKMPSTYYLWCFMPHKLTKAALLAEGDVDLGSTCHYLAGTAGSGTQSWYNTCYEHATRQPHHSLNMLVPTRAVATVHVRQGPSDSHLQLVLCVASLASPGVHGLLASLTVGMAMQVQHGQSLSSR